VKGTAAAPGWQSVAWWPACSPLCRYGAAARLAATWLLTAKEADRGRPAGCGADVDQLLPAHHWHPSATLMYTWNSLVGLQRILGNARAAAHGARGLQSDPELNISWRTQLAGEGAHRRRAHDCAGQVHGPRGPAPLAARPMVLVVGWQGRRRIAVGYPRRAGAYLVARQWRLRHGSKALIRTGDRARDRHDDRAGCCTMTAGVFRQMAVSVETMLACARHRPQCHLACSSIAPGSREPPSVRPRLLGERAPLPTPLRGCGLASMGVKALLPSGMCGMLGACSVEVCG
jgi:hypothetical protein